MTLISFILGFSLGVGLTIALILWLAFMFSKEEITEFSKELNKKQEARGL